MAVTLHCLADICLIPIGTNSSSVSDEITAITKLARDSPLETTLHSAGTTIAGPWDQVMDLIGQMHQLLHEKQGVVRIQSDIRVGTRVDKPNQLPQDKINVVQRKLAEQEKQS
ncbi:cell wall biogenesis protein, putative [Candida dubliniensis CD36]|uniref:Cell wall biogenesis protein, putative n=1 Tax=Candida dubliniensis (strain CD36 / ATCC MYA-646 / CBS 7987 / NCPF 3949 / NRRL Y-17841) TaxID=573826 RepID=B9WEM8_CANDC|nr:cell wall biogenesis protein, putative [Candida dubliniensis CD36]CAX43140.1 cell wall biogenesis protein, putative [Candida dubliniensis CD36]